MSSGETIVKIRKPWREVELTRLKSRLIVLDRYLRKFDILRKEREEILAFVKHLESENPSIKSFEKEVFPINDERPEKYTFALLQKCPKQFTTSDLMPFLEMSKRDSYNAVAIWKKKNWIRVIAHGLYEVAVETTSQPTT